ncbi:reverse transcriptase [Gossypium australe]|uniref:Reverse transcriptase n=1 Tax=Gossypium australe TaxID=47621 RepID=A0A5B6WPW8_9ROSI|nr:reverse transcriptase [Gossypium australe]
MRGAQTGRERFVLNHLFFANECVQFSDASRVGAQVVYNLILECESISSQKVNFDKSFIFIDSNVEARWESFGGPITNLFKVSVRPIGYHYASRKMMCWCILTKPTCLLLELFKAKYFPQTNFMYAKIGASPSLT